MQERPYLPTWEALKRADANGDIYLSIVLPESLHLRVLNGLRRESAKDKAFRMHCVEQDKSFTIGFNRLGDTLQVYIKWRSHVTNAFVGLKK